MTDIELFFKTVESEIRRKHIGYLKEQKCLPDREVSATEETITAKEFEKLKKLNNGKCGLIIWLVNRVRFIRRAKLVKKYNKGIETALKVVQREFKRFSKRIEEEINNA